MAFAKTQGGGTIGHLARRYEIITRVRFPEPTIRFCGGRDAGFKALAIAMTYGLRVSERTKANVKAALVKAIDKARGLNVQSAAQSQSG